jgi:hypothetical protein
MVADMATAAGLNALIPEFARGAFPNVPPA